jgi:hypothetical protein
MTRIDRLLAVSEDAVISHADQPQVQHLVIGFLRPQMNLPERNVSYISSIALASSLALCEC